MNGQPWYDGELLDVTSRKHGDAPVQGRTQAAVLHMAQRLRREGEAAYVRRPFTEAEDELVLTVSLRLAARVLGRRVNTVQRRRRALR